MSTPGGTSHVRRVQQVVPYLGYEDAAGAIEWLARAFDFTETVDDVDGHRWMFMERG